jgi:hypothetical protein
MYSDTINYTNTENDHSYALVSVSNAHGEVTDYRVYRTVWAELSDMDIIVN